MTATANGFRLQALLGRTKDSNRSQQAAAWLERHFTAPHTAGAFPEDRTQQAKSIYHYYVWTTALALDAIGRPVLETESGARHWAREFLIAIEKIRTNVAAR